MFLIFQDYIYIFSGTPWVLHAKFTNVLYIASPIPTYPSNSYTNLRVIYEQFFFFREIPSSASHSSRSLVKMVKKENEDSPKDIYDQRNLENTVPSHFR